MEGGTELKDLFSQGKFKEEGPLPFQGKLGGLGRKGNRYFPL